MAIAATIQPPSWISSGARVTGGLDLLGLRLPVQFIGGKLMNGVTTVTPSVRYLAFRAWLVRCYGQSGRPDRWPDFTEFAARIESALVLANLSQERSITGLIGTDDALDRLNAHSSHVEISALVKAPASTIYAGPSDQLGISKARGDAVPGLSEEYGVPLALAVEQCLSRNALIGRLLAQNGEALASPDELLELGAVARVDQIPDEERALLLAAIVPAKPLRGDRARIGTYASLLALASKLKAMPSESDLFNTVCARETFGEPSLDHVADGWMTYCVRDAIAVTQEAVMACVMDEILASEESGLGGVKRDVIIGALMDRVEEHDSALRDLGLLSGVETVTAMSFQGLRKRLQERLLTGSIQSRGLRRWADRLTEPLIYKRALKSGAGALSLAVVAWLLADMRIGDAAREKGNEYGGLSYQGRHRMGVHDVILPELERFHREDLPLRQVAAELAYRTVQQHLHITWARLQVDLRLDVALLTAEGNQWFSRGKGFYAGRTGSRIQQALGWLSQLKLIDGGGTTADGEDVLKKALEVLANVAAT